MPFIVGRVRSLVEDLVATFANQSRKAVAHRLLLVGGVPGPSVQLADDPHRHTGAVGPRRVTRELLVGQVRVVLQLAVDLDDVDAARAVATSELGAPRRGVEGSGDVYVIR